MVDGVACYLRVSSRAQDDAMQLHAIERAARARGDELRTVYREKRSAKTMAREELTRVRAAACAGEIRRLYVYRLDRLSRTGIRDTLECVEELAKQGCQVITVADGFELEGPAAPIILAVLAWAAQMERNAINERISAARELAAANGTAWGRPSRVDDKLRVRIHELRGEGRTIRAIAIALKVPKSTIERALRPTVRV